MSAELKVLKFISDLKMSINEAETGGAPSEGMDLDAEEVVSKDNPAGAGTSVPPKVKRQVKRGGNTKKEKLLRKEMKRRMRRMIPPLLFAKSFSSIRRKPI